MVPNTIRQDLANWKLKIKDFHDISAVLISFVLTLNESSKRLLYVVQFVATEMIQDGIKTVLKVCNFCPAMSNLAFKIVN